MVTTGRHARGPELRADRAYRSRVHPGRIPLLAGARGRTGTVGVGVFIYAGGT
jgi:hypothetical protein